MSEINLSWSGVNVAITQDFLDQMEISKAMQKSQAFRDYRVLLNWEISARLFEALEADGESEEVNFLLSQYIGELYSWQLDGETVDPEVKKD